MAMQVAAIKNSCIFCLQTKLHQMKRERHETLIKLTEKMAKKKKTLRKAISSIIEPSKRY